MGDKVTFSYSVTVLPKYYFWYILSHFGQVQNVFLNLKVLPAQNVTNVPETTKNITIWWHRNWQSNTICTPSSSGYAIEHSISAILWWSGASGTLGGKIDYLWAELIWGRVGWSCSFWISSTRIAIESLENAINFCHHMVDIWTPRIRNLRIESIMVGSLRASTLRGA